MPAWSSFGEIKTRRTIALITSILVILFWIWQKAKGQSSFLEPVMILLFVSSLLELVALGLEKIAWNSKKEEVYPLLRYAMHGVAIFGGLLVAWVFIQNRYMATFILAAIVLLLGILMVRAARTAAQNQRRTEKDEERKAYQNKQ